MYLCVSSAHLFYYLLYIQIEAEMSEALYPLLFQFHNKTNTYYICVFLGSARGIQSQHKPGEQLSEESSSCECALAVVWLSMLLLYSGL